jgi:hypothetical protein
MLYADFGGSIPLCILLGWSFRAFVRGLLQGLKDIDIDYQMGDG